MLSIFCHRTRRIQLEKNIVIIIIILVLDDSTDEIKIVLSKESLFCIDELTKVLPKKKRILAMLVEREEILRLLSKIYDLFGANHYR